MPRLRILHAASGTGKYIEKAPKNIRFVINGCANRPFYHIVLAYTHAPRTSPPIEQLGTYDPMPNFNNEKLVSFNYERIQFWIGKGANISRPIAKLLGLAGYLPIHPNTYLELWRKNKTSQAEASQKAAADAKTEVSAAQ